MTIWTPAAVAELINDVGQWVMGAIILYAIVRGLRTQITGEVVTGEGMEFIILQIRQRNVRHLPKPG